jgi:hypothetical protein
MVGTSRMYPASTLALFFTVTSAEAVSYPGDRAVTV